MYNYYTYIFGWSFSVFITSESTRKEVLGPTPSRISWLIVRVLFHVARAKTTSAIPTYRGLLVRTRSISEHNRPNEFLWNFIFMKHWSIYCRLQIQTKCWTSTGQSSYLDRLICIPTRGRIIKVDGRRDMRLWIIGLVDLTARN